MLDDPRLLLYALPGLLLGFVVHELAHAAVATALGDPTPRASGRLTLNPLAHIDFIGLLFLLVFRFGWAKPVLVNPAHFANPRAGMALVAAAGPLTNFILAYVAMALGKALAPAPDSALAGVLWLAVEFNVALGVFNMLPIPPLDGSKVLAGIVSGRVAQVIYQFENYGWLLMILLLTTGTLGRVLVPLREQVITGLDWLASLWYRVPGGGFPL